MPSFLKRQSFASVACTKTPYTREFAKHGRIAEPIPAKGDL